MPTYDKDGHLFGDAVFRAKYWELQNENEEMQIRYSEENGLEINGVGGGANRALDNLALPLEWVPGTMPEGNLYGTYWEAQGLFVGANTIDEAEAVYTTKDGSSWELFTVGITDFVPTYPIASSNDMLVISGLNGQKIDLAVTWDGDSWITALSKRGIANVYTAEYSGKYYIATNKNDVLVSTNKETFSVVALPSLGSANYTIMGMCSTKNAIIILFCDILSELNNKIVYSSNGSDWNVYEMAGSTSYGFLASDGTIAVRIPEKQANSMENAYFSKNGSSWSESEFDFSSAKQLLCDGTRFLAFNNTNGNAMISFDGETWETATLPVSPADTMLAGGGGRFILGKYSASEIYLTTAPAKTMKNLQPVINNIMAGIPSGGGGGGDVVKIVYDEDTMSAEDLGVAVKAICDAGKIPAIVLDSNVFYCQLVNTEEGYFDGQFISWVFTITDGDVVTLGVVTLVLEYIAGDGWTLQDVYKEVETVGR